MKYEPLPFFSNEDALNILNSNDTENIALLPLSLGEYCDDWKFAQNICLTLIENQSQAIIANAFLGLSYIARNHRKLEKIFVEEAILKVLKTNLDGFALERIMYSIEDIYDYMKWKKIGDISVISDKTGE